MYDEKITDNNAERKALNRIREDDPPLRRFVLERLNRMTYDVRTLVYGLTNLYDDVNPDLMSIVVYRELIKELREQMEICAVTAMYEGANKSNIARAAGVTQGGLKNAMPDLDKLEKDFEEVLATGKSKITTVRGSTRRILHPRTAGCLDDIPYVEYRNVPEMGEQEEPYDNVVAITQVDGSKEFSEGKPAITINKEQLEAAEQQNQN